MNRRKDLNTLLNNTLKHLLIVTFSLFFIISCGEKKENIETVEKSGFEIETTEFGIPLDSLKRGNGVIKKNQFFAGLLYELGVDNNEVHRLTQASKGIFDFRKIKVGHKYHTFFTTEKEPELAYLVYENSRNDYAVFQLKDSLCVTQYCKETSIVDKYVEVEISNSLWLDTQEAGVPVIIALKLADIYAWSIDFFGLRKGDSFKVLYQELICDNEILDVGDIKYAIFTHQDRDYEAIYFAPESKSTNHYWSEDGKSLKKAFLKAPLHFKRISSGFSYRRVHPITRKVRPHTGIDYAAPTGTPVVSIGDGVITRRSYDRAGGNTVKIKHNSVYASAYLHLSRYGKGIKVGSRVKQGQIIGYVGSTGGSTGPHLDFRIWKNSIPINPLKMVSPPAEPLKNNKKAELKAQLKSYKYQIDSLKAEIALENMILKLTNK